MGVASNDKVGVVEESDISFFHVYPVFFVDRGCFGIGCRTFAAFPQTNAESSQSKEVCGERIVGWGTAFQKAPNTFILD